MSKELVISANRHETRVAVIEEDQVVEVYHQRENEYSLAGSIHKGRVTRVLPGMQSAFVDIGLDRDAFLYVSDFFEDNEEYDKIVTSVEEKVLKLDRTGQPIAAAAPETAAAPAGVESAPAAPGEEPRPNRGRAGRAEPLGPAHRERCSDIRIRSATTATAGDAARAAAAGKRAGAVACRTPSTSRRVRACGAGSGERAARGPGRALRAASGAAPRHRRGRVLCAAR